MQLPAAELHLADVQQVHGCRTTARQVRWLKSQILLRPQTDRSGSRSGTKKKSCFRIETWTTTDSDSNLLTGSSKNFDSAAFFIFRLKFQKYSSDEFETSLKAEQIAFRLFSLYLKLD